MMQDAKVRISYNHYIMASKSLFGSFKHYLKLLLILGLFPWKFDKAKQTLRALDLKIHIAIVLANYVIWSLPWDIHYYPFMVSNFINHISESEIDLFQFFIRRIGSFVHFIALQIVHYITCLSLRHKFCLFYQTNQKRLNLYNVSWTMYNLRSWMVFSIIFVSCLLSLFCDANTFVIWLYGDEPMEIPMVFGLIKDLQSLLFYTFIIPIILDITSAFYSWIKILERKISNAEIIEETLHECIELIQACEELKDLFPKYLNWIVLVGLIKITKALLNLCEVLVNFYLRNPQADIINDMPDRPFEYIMGHVSILTTALPICFGMFSCSNTIKNGLKQLQLILKKTYFPKRMKMKWKGKEVPAKFVVQQIIDDIERFQGFISIKTSSVMIWFFTFFLFFLQFGIQSPPEEQQNVTNLTCFCNCPQICQ